MAVFKKGNNRYIDYYSKGRLRKEIGPSKKLAEQVLKDVRVKIAKGEYLGVQGVDLKTVRQVMGHKEIKMTMRYSHLSPEYVQDAMGHPDTLWTPSENNAREQRS